MKPAYICKYKYVVTMMGQTSAPDSSLEIVAIIESEEGLPLWDLLKSKETPKDILAKLLIKHRHINIYGYSLVEFEKRGEEDAAVTKDSFVTLRGEYRL